MEANVYLLVTQNGNNGVFVVKGDLRMPNLETTDGIAIAEMSNGTPIVVDCMPELSEDRIGKVMDDWIRKKKFEITNG